MKNAIILLLLVVVVMGYLFTPYHYWQMMQLTRTMAVAVVGFVVGYLVGKLSKDVD